MKILSFDKHFICAYKPPDERNDQFINYLESIVHSLNLENDIFIVGDLYMNWLDKKGEPLKAYAPKIISLITLVHLLELFEPRHSFRLL